MTSVPRPSNAIGPVYAEVVAGAPRGTVLHLGPLGGGRTFCGRATDAVHWWATPGLADRDDFLPGVRRCASCRASFTRSHEFDLPDRPEAVA